MKPLNFYCNRLLLVFGLFLSVLAGSARADATITTVAGNGTYAYCGDGGPATSACFEYPQDVALDPAGNLYILDNVNDRVRKVDVNTGIITTVAGNGTEGYSGDGGPATSASLNLPWMMASDAAGNLYITEWYNPRVRKVDINTGIITTVAGNGAYGYCGIEDEPATSACLHSGDDVAVDAAGNLYIGDVDRVRKVDTNGIITTVAGNGTNGYSGDGGPATSAGLDAVRGTAVDGAGNLYIAGGGRVRKVDSAGIITTVAGTGNGSCNGLDGGGPATSADFFLSSYGALAADAAGNLYISGCNRVLKVDTAGIITTVAGNGTYGYSGDGGPATDASLGEPRGVAVASTGEIFIGDTYNWVVRRVGTTDRVTPHVYISNHPSSVSSDTPRVIAIDPLSNSQIASIPMSANPGELVAHPDGNTVYAINADGDLSVIDVATNTITTTLAGVGSTASNNQMVVSPDGSKLYLLYRTNSLPYGGEIKVFDVTAPKTPSLTTTIPQSQFSDGCRDPLGLGIRPDGSKLYIACRIGGYGTPSPFYMMDTATNAITQTATFAWPQANGLDTNALAVNQDGTRVYLMRAYNSSHAGASTVEVYDGATGTNIASIPMPARALPRAGVVSPDNASLYVVDLRLGTHVIDTATNTIQLTMPAAQTRGADIALFPDGSHVYPTLGNRVSVVNTSTNSWESSISGDFTSARQVTVTPSHP